MILTLDERLRQIYDEIGDQYYWEGSMGKGDPELEPIIDETIKKIKQAFKEIGRAHV